MPIQVWIQKIGRIKTLCQQLLNGNRGVVSPVKRLWKSPQAELPSSSCPEERKATVVLELNSPGRNMSQFLPLQAMRFLVQQQCNYTCAAWVFLQF